MNIITINIGLNNNPYNLEQLTKLFNNTKEFKHIIFEVQEGIYNLKKEFTFIVEGETKQTSEQIESFISNLCTLLNQDCIAFSLDISKDNKQINKLIYNKNYIGLKEEFNKEYFLSIGEYKNKKEPLLFSFLNKSN